MLIMLRGVPCSGKSRLIQALTEEGLLKPYEVVSSDEMRCVLGNNPINQSSSAIAFKMIKEVVNYRIQQKLLTVVDSTALNIKNIRDFIKIARENYVPMIVMSVNPPEFEELERRNNLRYLRTGMRIPSEVMKNMYDRYFSGMVGFEQWDNNEKFFNHVRVDGPEDAKEFVRAIHVTADVGTTIRIASGKDCWVIGDVHGCANELESLVKRIKRENPNASIFTVGDLIDRGPDWQGCIRIVSEEKILSTVGNHESSFVAEYNGKPCNSKAREKTHEEFAALSETDQQSILKYFNRMYHYIVVEANDQPIGALITHSGIPSVYGEPQCQYDPNLRDYVGTNETSLVGRIPPRSRFSEKPLRQVYGHKQWEFTSLNNLVDEIDEVDAINVDSGCVYGRGLTAVNPFTGEIRVAPSEQIYYVTGGKK